MTDSPLPPELVDMLYADDGPWEPKVDSRPMRPIEELLAQLEPEPDMIPLYIFDLDGTLALTDHRQHLVRQQPFDWPAFFAACVNDSPNWPVISTMVTLLDKGCDVWIWSGRSAAVMNETRTWLQHHIAAERADEIELCMRREGDYTPDEQLKEGWLKAMSAFDRKRLVAVFDYRDKVVAMWRRNGLACFQVAPGEF
jgi:hypothetical protein